MLKQIIRSAIAAVALTAGLSAPASAQLAPLYNQLMNTVQQQLMKTLMAKMGVGVEGAVAQSGAATQAEILKAATARKAFTEGLEAYRQQQDLIRKTQDKLDDLKQPATTCQTMSTQGGLGNAMNNARASVAPAQRKVMDRVSGTASTMKAVEELHQQSNGAFCTAAEAERGVCNATSQKDYQGADRNVAFLFQGTDGSGSYKGEEGSIHAKAVDTYIQRVVSSVPAEQLKGVDYNKNPAGRAYVELQRRYSSMLSMSSYSLNQLSQQAKAQVGLGESTAMATIDVEGYEPGKNDMSMKEAVQRFIALKFSPASIRDSAKAKSENLILRDMAQMNSFQLWIEHQTLLQDSRTEGLMAHQLALMTEQALRPQLEAQRQAATRTPRQ